MKTILDLSDKTVTVGPHDYRVFMPYTFRDVNYMGLALHGSREIKVSVTCDDDTVKPEPSILEIFIHEVLHCIDEVYFSRTMFPEDVKEDKIDVLSSGLVQALGMRLKEEEKKTGVMHPPEIHTPLPFPVGIKTLKDIPEEQLLAYSKGKMGENGVSQGKHGGRKKC